LRHTYLVRKKTEGWTIEVNACSLILPRLMIAASCKSINMNFYLWAADAKGEKVKSERREWARDAGSTRALTHALWICTE